MSKYRFPNQRVYIGDTDVYIRRLVEKVSTVSAASVVPGQVLNDVLGVTGFYDAVFGSVEFDGKEFVVGSPRRRGRRSWRTLAPRGPARIR